MKMACTVTQWLLNLNFAPLFPSSISQIFLQDLYTLINLK
jgi:hypothetical protein